MYRRHSAFNLAPGGHQRFGVRSRIVAVFADMRGFAPHAHLVIEGRPDCLGLDHHGFHPSLDGLLEDGHCFVSIDRPLFHRLFFWSAPGTQCSTRAAQ